MSLNTASHMLHGLHGDNIEKACTVYCHEDNEAQVYILMD